MACGGATYGIRPPPETFVNTESGLASCRLRRGRVQSKAITYSSLQRGNVDCALDYHLYQTLREKVVLQKIFGKCNVHEEMLHVQPRKLLQTGRR
jgi:hypothetical protein